MSRTTYTFEPKEMAVRELRLDGSGPARWLLCLGYEERNGHGCYVGTVWSVRNNQPLREGDILTIPYRMLSFPIAVEEPDGWRHYVVLRRFWRFSRRYRLTGVRGGSEGRVRTLEIPLVKKVGLQREEQG